VLASHFFISLLGNLSSALRQYSSDVDDAGLLESARTGDEDAFSQLFARHQRPIYQYSARMCGADAADDIVQETFLAVLKPAGRFDPARGTVGGYLYGIARHVVMKRLASTYGPLVFETPDENAFISPDETPLDAIARAETVDAVRTAVQALPPVYREAIVLCELQDMDYATAAGIMQCPIGTVRSRLHRARALLTSRLACRNPNATTSC
jgi:RNA polymerase sigma-70 factor (ECF subfamily)